MKRKDVRFKQTSRLVGAIIGASLASNCLAQESTTPCLPDSIVKAVIQEIPKRYEEVRPDVYLIAKVASSYASEKAGQLTGYISRNLFDGSRENWISFFDRTDQNHLNWYNIDNSKDSTNQIGRVSGKLNYFERHENPLSTEDAQIKFNAIIEKIWKDIQNSKKESN